MSEFDMERIIYDEFDGLTGVPFLCQGKGGCATQDRPLCRCRRFSIVVHRLLQTQTSSMRTLTDARQMQDLPLNGRNFIRLAQIAPGS
jgi:hypothetical protein